MKKQTKLKKQKGFSLVELLVATAIALFLMAGLSAIFVSSSATTKTSTEEAQMNEDAALVLQMLAHQLRLAGFSNVTGNVTSGKAVPNFAGSTDAYIMGCSGKFTDAGIAFTNLSCTTGSAKTSDSFAVRYEADTVNTPLSTAGRPTNCSFNEIASNSATTAGTNYALADNRYYVENNALRCQGATGDASFSAAAELVPNIERMVVKYAVTAPVAAAGTASAAAASEPQQAQVTAYVKAGEAPLNARAGWARVVGANLCIEMRSPSPVPIQANNREAISYWRDCDGVEHSDVTDGYLRRSYHTTVMLRNRMPVVPGARL